MEFPIHESAKEMHLALTQNPELKSLASLYKEFNEDENKFLEDWNKEANYWHQLA